MRGNVVLDYVQEDGKQYAQAGNSGNIGVEGLGTVVIQNLVTVTTPSDPTFISGAAKDTFTYPSKAASTAGDYAVVYDGSGLGWAAALNKAGNSPAPTGAIYAAIPAGRKVNVDISAATTAAQVAALVRTAYNALTGFTAAITCVDPTDGTLTFQRLVAGAVTVSKFKSTDDSGAGSITGAVNNAGAAGTVSLSGDSVTAAAHGLVTGQKITALTTTGTLPAGLATSTIYYAIKVDLNTLQFASSLVNANAGTAVDITDIGYGTHTIGVTALASATVTVQESIDGTNWYTKVSALSLTTTTSTINKVVDPEVKFYRLLYAVAAGQITATTRVFGKN